MLVVGPVLFAIAVIALILAAPREGKVRMADAPFLQNAVALGVTITGAVGIVVTFIALTAHI